MSEEIESLIGKIKGGITLTNVRIGLFDIQGNALFSSLGEKASEIASKLTKGAFEAWDVGDYQVKRLEKGCILISRVTPKLALALDSYEREGLVIVAMGALMKKFAPDFSKIDQLLPGMAVPEKVVETVSIEPSAVVKSPEPITESLAPVTTPVPPEKKEEISKSVFVNIEASDIFSVSKSSIGKVDLDPIMISIVRVVDGIRSIEEVIKLAGLEMKNALPKIFYLIQHGVLRYSIDFELINLIYQYVYELIPPYTIDNVSQKACSGRSDEVVTVMTNLDQGYTVSQLAMGLKKVGFAKTSKDILDILKFYEGRKVVKIKRMGFEDPDPNWVKDPNFQIIYVYSEGMNFETVNKNIVIADKKTVTILKNLDLRLNVLELTMGLKGLGMSCTPNDVLKILQELERRGVLRKTI